MSINYQRLNTGDIAVGEPVPWALYDEDHKLLLARGVKLASERQMQALMDRGLFRVVKTSEAVAKSGDGEKRAEAPKEIKQLDEIRLGIGDSLQMQGRAQGDDSRYYVKLVGFVKGSGVVVTNPVVDGRMVLVREGQGFVVRMFSGKSAYAFVTNVVRVTNVPFPHVFLEYPKEVRGLVVRRGARAKVQLIAAVVGQDGRQFAGTIGDLSIGGAMLTAKSPVGDRNATVSVKFRVEINAVEQFLTVPAIIRNIRPEAAADGSGKVYQHGLQFTELPPAEQVALSGYVYQSLFEESSEL